MNLEELYDYKNRLMADICKNDEIVRLVTGNPEAAVPNHALPYTQIYPYEMVPETVSVAKTFVCFDVDIPDVQNKTVLTPVIYLWVFTHKSRLRADGGGVLLDKIVMALDKMLNGNRFYSLGTLDLKSVYRFMPADDYRGKVMTFTATDFNRHNGIKRPLPSNRREGR